MRTIERFAFIFGIANLILGALSLFSPFVTPRPRRGLARFLPRRHNRGIINRQEGMLLGGLGAVNPPHAILHSALGAVGVATRRFSDLARPYMWLNALMFLGMAVLGWTSIGREPGIHNVKGIALDRRDNIIHTLWGAAALLLALNPGRSSHAQDAQREGLRMVEAGLSD